LNARRIRALIDAIALVKQSTRRISASNAIPHFGPGLGVPPRFRLAAVQVYRLPL
jgi:hypothetical protein